MTIPDSYLQHTLVDGVVPKKTDGQSHKAHPKGGGFDLLPVPRHDDTDTTTGNILEPDVESTELPTYTATKVSALYREHIGDDVPMTKNMPYGFFGYSTSGKNSGARRNDSATLVGW